MNSLRIIFVFLILSFEIQGSVILIDPGHGGEDTGAKSPGKHAVFEKDLTLKLATKIQEYLQKKHVCYLTRSLDRTVTLMERADMAEKVKADFFISVHINSNTDKSSHGFETYYLDNHNDVANKKVEAVENAVLSAEDKVINQILIDLVIQNTEAQSKKLAQTIHASLRRTVEDKFHLTSRGVKPGLFYVLALSKRPGVLLEAGFISNPGELNKLRNHDFQEAYARSVAEGIERFLSVNKRPVL
ncbi:MAG: N-acetylmuramoyl-L-alanine amidase family protein [Bacteriovoracaceae bacterium]